MWDGLDGGPLKQSEQRLMVSSLLISADMQLINLQAGRLRNPIICDHKANPGDYLVMAH